MAWMGYLTATKNTVKVGGPGHQGRWCYGKTPMRTFLDSVPMAKEKLIPSGGGERIGKELSR